MAIVVAGVLGTNVAWPLTSWQLFSRLRGPTQSTCQGDLRVVARVSLGVSPPTTVVVSREPVERC